MLTYSDECHHAAADSAIEVLQELTAQYVYGVTATPKRGDGKEKINEFLLGPVRYRSSLPMDSIGETSVEHRQKNSVATVDTPFNLELNSTQIKIIELLSANSNMTGVDLSEAIGISKRNIEVNLKKLKEKGVLVRHGSSKGGYWEAKAHE